MVLGLMGALLAFMSYRRRNNLSLLPSVSLQMPQFLRAKKFAHPATDAISTASTLNLSSAHNSELSPSETNNSNIVNNIELILI